MKISQKTVLSVTSIFITLAAGVLFSCAKKSIKQETSAAEPVTLLMAEVNPPDTIVGQMDIAFKEKVEELSGGTIKIDLQMNCFLGNIEETFARLNSKENPVHIIRISISNLSSLGCEKTPLLTLPYTFSSRNHFWAFADSPLAKEFLDEPVDQGLNIKGLFFGEEGFRHFFSIDPLTKIEDFKGKSVRLPDDTVQKKLVNQMGASSVQLGFDVLKASMESGLASIAEQPVSNYLANAFYTFAPNLILDGHTLGAVEAVISLEKWNSLTEEQQSILLEAGKYASEYCRTISEETENKAINTLKGLGVKITEVKDKTPWKKVAEPVQKEFSARYPDLYKKILELETAAPIK